MNLQGCDSLIGYHLVVVVSREVQVSSRVKGRWSCVPIRVCCGDPPKDFQCCHVVRLCSARLRQKRAQKDCRLSGPSLNVAASECSSLLCFASQSLYLHACPLYPLFFHCQGDVGRPVNTSDCCDVQQESTEQPFNSVGGTGYMSTFSGIVSHGFDFFLSRMCRKQCPAHQPAWVWTVQSVCWIVHS